MNKLVLKNPVLKFKLGKIIKAYRGDEIHYTGRDGRRYIASRFGNNWLYRELNGNIWKTTPKDYTMKETGVGFYDTKGGARSYDDIVANSHILKLQQQIRNKRNKPISTTNLVTETRTKPVTTTPTTENPFNVNDPSTWGRSIGIVTVTPKTPTPTYYATRAYRNSLNIDRLGLKSRADVLAYLKELNKLGANIKEDGIWGDNTNAAYLKYKGFKPGNDEILIPTTSVTTSTNSIGTDIKDINNIHPEKLDVEYSYNYNPVYDRSMTRDWIRNNLKINPYSVSGAHRRALRYWLNGDKEGLNYDKNLLGVFGNLTRFAKQGAKLVLRSPVKRFKTLNFFRKVDQ